MPRQQSWFDHYTCMGLIGYSFVINSEYERQQANQIFVGFMQMPVPLSGLTLVQEVSSSESATLTPVAGKFAPWEVGEGLWTQESAREILHFIKFHRKIATSPPREIHPLAKLLPVKL